MNPLVPTPIPPDEPDTEKGSRTMLIGLILVSVALAAVAQLILKSGMNHVTRDGAIPLAFGDPIGTFRRIVVAPLVWAGLLTFVVSAAVWLLVLSRVPLSFAYPFAALGYVVIVLFSLLVLHEHVPPLRWAGVGLIVAGIVLVAQTPHR